MTTREQIIAAAKEAGIHENWNPADWYQVSPEQLPIFYNIAYEAGAASMDAEIADLKRELDNEQARDIHSCHPNCSRVGCVNRRLRAELAAEQAKNVKLREVLKKTTVALEHRWEVIANRAAPVLEGVIDEAHSEGIIALATPSDTSALEAIVKKAGEVMRGRCAQSADDNCHFSTCDSIQLLPAVTLEDLK